MSNSPHPQNSDILSRSLILCLVSVSLFRVPKANTTANTFLYAIIQQLGVVESETGSRACIVRFSTWLRQQKNGREEEKKLAFCP